MFILGQAHEILSILSLSNYEKMKYFENFLHNFYFVTALTLEIQDDHKPLSCSEWCTFSW